MNFNKTPGFRQRGYHLYLLIMSSNEHSVYGIEFHQIYQNMGKKYTDSMEHSPACKANSSSACQEISCIFWNLKVYFHVLENYRFKKLCL